MDYKNLTREELLELVEKPEPVEEVEESTRVVRANGHTFEIDEKAAHSWRVFGAARKMTAANDIDAQITAAFSIVEIATGLDESAFVELHGGDDADYNDVLSTLAELVGEITRKK